MTTAGNNNAILNIYAVEALLRDADKIPSLQQFYYNTCPKFQHWRPADEFDLQMTAIHHEFLALIDGYIRDSLQNTSVSIDSLITSVSAFPVDDYIFQRLLSTVAKYTDFQYFGSMMQSIFQAKYYNEIKLNGQKLVRVLWDIENIGVPATMNPIDVVERIQVFLTTIGLYKSGVNLHITAFGNIANRTLIKTLADLDKAGVEIVWCSRKREDADRKLVKRFHQYLEELPVALLSLVVISSDQDFRTEYQLARGRGFDVIVIHNAESRRWIQVSV